MDLSIGFFPWWASAGQSSRRGSVNIEDSGHSWFDPIRPEKRRYQMPDMQFGRSLQVWSFPHGKATLPVLDVQQAICSGCTEIPPPCRKADLSALRPAHACVYERARPYAL